MQQAIVPLLKAGQVVLRLMVIMHLLRAAVLQQEQIHLLQVVVLLVRVMQLPLVQVRKVLAKVH